MLLWEHMLVFPKLPKRCALVFMRCGQQNINEICFSYTCVNSLKWHNYLYTTSSCYHLHILFNNNINNICFQESFFTLHSAYNHLNKSMSRHPVVSLKKWWTPICYINALKEMAFQFLTPTVSDNSKFRNIFLFPFCIFKRLSSCFQSEEICFDQRF